MDSSNWNETMISKILTTSPKPIIIPSWKMQDIIRLVILPILFALGAPLNLAALSHLMSEKKSSSSSGAARMHLLKLHLNISDLMILFVYTASQICWLITYEWRGGEFLCKFIKFSHTLSFGISSNVVVCIAFDRIASVFESKRRRSDERRKPGLRRVKISLLLAWLAAVICAIPQFLVWTTYKPFPPPNTWTQCVSIFFVQDASKKNNQTQLLITKTQYAAFHVLVIFWIPAFFIAVCYLNVMAWLLCHGRVGPDGCTRFIESIRNRLFPNSIPPQDHRRCSSMGGRPTRAAQMSVTIDEGRASICTYGALEPPENGIIPILNPSSPKGSGCSSTPLLGMAVGEHRRSGTSGSRNTSANIIISPAVLELQRVKRKAMRSSVLLVSAYILTWLPYNLIAIWGLVDETHYKKYGVNVSFLQYLIVLNSVINPFLYGTVGRLRKYVSNN